VSESLDDDTHRLQFLSAQQADYTISIGHY